jgi:hypothetical protein
MNDEQVKKILEDPKKMLDFLRLGHQLIHLYDAEETRKEMENENQGTKAQAGLGDTLSIILRDKDGKIKQEKKSN